MRICVDMDGTICQNKVGSQDYYDVTPIPGAPEALRALKEKGYYVVIHTARGMKTFSNNEGQIIAAHGSKLTAWLHKWRIPFDELLFAKPHVDYFIDDKGFRFTDWNETLNFLENERIKKL